MNTSDHSLIAFKSISTFVKELAEIFSAKNHPLKLYARLLNKTTLNHDTAITKHVEAFRNFCIENRDNIISKNNNFTNSKVNYSTNVYIDFEQIFKDVHEDKETENIIWKHILTISALLDPSGKAKEILKKEDTKEATLITDIIDTVEKQVKPDANLFEAISSITNSGVFTDLLSSLNTGVNEGSLDLTKIIGTVQNLCAQLPLNELGSQLGSQPGFDPASMINMLKNLDSSGSARST